MAAAALRPWGGMYHQANALGWFLPVAGCNAAAMRLQCGIICATLPATPSGTLHLPSTALQFALHLAFSGAPIIQAFPTPYPPCNTPQPTAHAIPPGPWCSVLRRVPWCEACCFLRSSKQLASGLQCITCAVQHGAANGRQCIRTSQVHLSSAPHKCTTQVHHIKCPRSSTRRTTRGHV
jgi:hypothetical protein